MFPPFSATNLRHFGFPSVSSSLLLDWLYFFSSPSLPLFLDLPLSLPFTFISSYGNGDGDQDIITNSACLRCIPFPISFLPFPPLPFLLVFSRNLHNSAWKGCQRVSIPLFSPLFHYPYILPFS
jgi:hypothetical protein